MVVRPTFTASTALHQLWHQLRVELGTVLRGKAFIVIILFGVLNVVGAALGTIDEVFGTPILPVTHLMVRVIDQVSALFVIIVITSIRGLSLYLQTIQTNRLALRVMQDLQESMFSRLVRADYARLIREPVGALVSRFTNDITLLREVLVRSANNLLRDTLTIIGA